MTVTLEQIEQVRAVARTRDRHLTDTEQMRRELAGVIDVGALDDADVRVLYGNYQAARPQDGAA